MPPMDNTEQVPPMPMSDNEMPSVDGLDDSLNDGEEPINNIDSDETNTNDDDNELMDIINGLSIEDKAAVEKYAKSMQDDSSDDVQMENESFIRRFKNAIDETLNSFVDSKCDDERVGNMPKEYRKLSNPFKSPFK